MNLFIIGIAWSQTDHENVLVSARTIGDANEKVKKAYPGIHHITSTRLINHMLLGDKK